MITNPNKNKEAAKNEPKKMPDLNQSKKFDSGSAKENQTPNKFAHKLNKEETHEPKKTEAPTSSDV